MSLRNKKSNCPDTYRLCPAAVRAYNHACAHPGHLKDIDMNPPAGENQEASSRRLEGIVRDEALLWGDDVRDSYHARAENDMDRHWQSLVWPFLSGSKIDLSAALDFACGYGRNTAKLLEAGAKRVTLVDVNIENIHHCQKRFQNIDAIAIVQNNGYDLREIPDSSITFFYCFDAMVHFDVEVIIAYMPEISRVLAPGGQAFIHHSNYVGAPGADFRQNPHWRNFMSRDLFKHLAMHHGFAIERQALHAWGGVADLDCLTLMRKQD